MKQRLQKKVHTYTNISNDKIESSNQIMTLFVTKLLCIVTCIFKTWPNEK